MPKVMVVNFANNENYGGGYLNGCRAQEEDLFRSSVLPRVLDANALPHYYPINPQHADANALYFDDVHILRRSAAENYGYLSPDEVARYKVQVCSVAAFDAYSPGGRDAPMFQPGGVWPNQCPFSPAGLANTRARIETQFQMAIEKGSEVLIVGAFGCGAFYNQPDAIIALYREVLDKYNGQIRKVMFAVLGDANYAAFKSGIE